MSCFDGVWCGGDKKFYHQEVSEINNIRILPVYMEVFLRVNGINEDAEWMQEYENYYWPRKGHFVDH